MPDQATDAIPFLLMLWALTIVLFGVWQQSFAAAGFLACASILAFGTYVEATRG